VAHNSLETEENGRAIAAEGCCKGDLVDSKRADGAESVFRRGVLQLLVPHRHRARR